MGRNDLSARELGQWIVGRIQSEPIGDRFNYGACDALYHCGLRLGEMTDEEDVAIRRVLDKHRRQATEAEQESPFGFPGR